MDTRYRLHTENVNRPAIEALVSRYFPGFSITENTGYYKGTRERSLVIEILAPGTLAHVIKFLGKAIAQANAQECVLITADKVTGEFVNGY